MALTGSVSCEPEFSVLLTNRYPKRPSEPMLIPLSWFAFTSVRQDITETGWKIRHEMRGSEIYILALTLAGVHTNVDSSDLQVCVANTWFATTRVELQAICLKQAQQVGLTSDVVLVTGPADKRLRAVHMHAGADHRAS